jgi:hypothetical protein
MNKKKSGGSSRDYMDLAASTRGVPVTTKPMRLAGTSDLVRALAQGRRPPTAGGNNR